MRDYAFVVLKMLFKAVLVILFIAGLLAMYLLKLEYDNNHRQPPEGATIIDLSQSRTFSQESSETKELQSITSVEKP